MSAGAEPGGAGPGSEAADGEAAGWEADGARAAGAEAADGAHGFGWLAAVCAVAGECAVYGGLAAGGRPTALINMWPLAVMTVISVAVTDLLGACRGAAIAAGRCRELGRSPAIQRWTGRLLCPPLGVRALLAAVGLAAGGPQAALFTVLAAEVIAFTSTVAMLARIALPGSWPDGSGATGSQRRDPAAATRRTPVPRVTAIVGVPGRPGMTSAVRIITSTAAEGETARPPEAPGTGWAAPPPAAFRTVRTAPTPAETAGTGWAAPPATAAGAGGTARPATAAGAGGIARPAAAAGAGEAARSGGTVRSGGMAAATATATATAAATAAGVPRPGSLDVVLALRDDGRAARWAWLVQGNLIPLPPALAGLIATAMLAALGLRGLPGFIAMTPPVVMMLAAPGSSHPHDGRFDWLVPVLLALAQYVYLGALGFALGVPGPVTFSLCALTFLWYAGITAEARGTVAGERGLAAGRAGPGPRIGWETRLFAAGLAATFGLATFGYLGLATYLGVLICRKVLIGYLIPREEDHR